MKWILLIIATLNLLPFGMVAQEDYAKEMTAEELKEDFNIFKHTIQTIHPNLYLYMTPLESDSILANIEKSLDHSMTPIEFFRKLTPYIHHIRNAHTTIRPPQSYIDYVMSDAKTLPLKFIYTENILIVTEIKSSEIKIKPGAIVKKINGMAVDSLMGRLAKFTFTDGYNENYSQYLSSQYLNTRYAYTFGLPAEYVIDYIDLDGTAYHETVKPIAWHEPSSKASSSNNEHKYSFRIENNIGFLTIHSFSLDLKSFEKFLKNSFAELTDKQIKSLVIDVRDNRGGSQEATNELLGYFITEPVYPIKEKFAVVDKLPHQEYFKKDNSFKYFHKEKLKETQGKYIGVSDAHQKVNPKKNQFHGNLFLLINENCASATTSFLGQIRTHRPDARFIGRETLGNPQIVVADYVVSLVLPNSNIIAKIPLVSSEKNVRFVNPKRGVVPDIEVKLSLEEIQWNLDAIKEKAIEEINKI